MAKKSPKKKGKGVHKHKHYASKSEQVHTLRRAKHLALIVAIVILGYLTFDVLGKTAGEYVAHRQIKDTAWIEYNQGNYDVSVDQFTQVLARNPQDQEAALGLGWSYYQMDDHAAAMEVLSPLKETLSKEELEQDTGILVDELIQSLPTSEILSVQQVDSAARYLGLIRGLEEKLRDTEGMEAVKTFVYRNFLPQFCYIGQGFICDNVKTDREVGSVFFQIYNPFGETLIFREGTIDGDVSCRSFNDKNLKVNPNQEVFVSFSDCEFAGVASNISITYYDVYAGPTYSKTAYGNIVFNSDMN